MWSMWLQRSKRNPKPHGLDGKKPLQNNPCGPKPTSKTSGLDGHPIETAPCLIRKPEVANQQQTHWKNTYERPKAWAVRKIQPTPSPCTFVCAGGLACQTQHNVARREVWRTGNRITLNKQKPETKRFKEAKKERKKQTNHLPT